MHFSSDVAQKGHPEQILKIEICSQNFKKMDERDNAIEGFVRRPKKRIIWPEIITISDEDSDAEPSLPRNDNNAASVIKREATDNETTGSELLIPDDIALAGKKKRKKKKMSRRELKQFIKDAKRKLKKEYVSDDISDSA